MNNQATKSNKPTKSTKSTKFNVGDTVKFTSEWRKYLSRTGCIKAVGEGRYYIDGCIKDGYFVEWDGGEPSWISEGKLSLVKDQVEPTVKSAKELKAELQSEILGLIREFNKKTTLEVQDIDLDYYRALDGKCFYQVHVKVEI